MITSPLFFPCRLLKKRRDDLVGTTMFTAFLLSSSESRIPILTAVPLTNVNLCHLTVAWSISFLELNIFGEVPQRQAGNRKETNQLCLWDQL